MVDGLYKWFSIGILALLHPFYVSVIEVEHNADEKTLEISCKIFTDDLEAVLLKNYGTLVDFKVASQKETQNKLVTDYIQKHLVLKTDGKPVKLEFVGFEEEREAIWVYCQVSGVPTVKKLELDVSILHDYNESQINLVHATAGGERKSYKLDFPKRTVQFEWSR
ncbi:MAG: hypothetical protein JNN29_06595 [Chitinophagaceae bacterium]|nr:hypothetical protein [Chitinophagaceae bacterium]